MILHTQGSGKSGPDRIVYEYHNVADLVTALGVPVSLSDLGEWIGAAD